MSPQGEIFESYSFDSFGNHQITSPTSHYEKGLNPWRFQGKRYDPVTEWVHFGFRDYSPELGRWMTPDPAGFVDSVNLYQYLYNNPHKYYDPKGKFVVVLPLFSFCFGAAGITAFTLPSLITIAEITTTAAIAYYAGQAIYQLNELDQGLSQTEEENLVS